MPADPPRVFAYGSLLYEPEAAGALVGRQTATLAGWRRSVDKISGPRGCAHDDACAAAPAGFCVDGWHRSLALGLARDAAGEVVGGVLEWAPGGWPAVRRALDRREGVVPGRADRRNGYRRRVVEVQTESGVVQAWVYVSNPDSVWSGADLSLDARADVLAAATPRRPTAYARGADYVARTARTLADHGVVDPHLDRLLEALRARLGGRLDAG